MRKRWIVLLLLSLPLSACGPHHFRVEYRPPQNADLVFYYLAFAFSRWDVTALLDEVAQRVALPQDIPVVFQECGTPNAFYSPARKAIIACYELPKHIETLFREVGVQQRLREQGQDVEFITWSAFVHALFHEIGHGLIDMYDLPVTGREEDAADQFSTFLLLQVAPRGGGAMAIASAAGFFLTAYAYSEAHGEVGELPFWSEHGLNKQRYYNLLCWLYGSDPVSYASIANEGLLPQDRAVRCPEETAQLVRSWTQLLGKRLRQ
jgi:hypothetical protein